jgi:hypothetical protein
MIITPHRAASHHLAELQTREPIKHALQAVMHDLFGKYITGTRNVRRSARIFLRDHKREVEAHPLAIVGGGLTIGMVIGGAIGWAANRRS